MDYSEKWEIFIGAGREFLEGDIYIEDEAIKKISKSGGTSDSASGGGRYPGN